MVSLWAFSIVTFSFVLSYKQPSLKLCSDKALWILRVTFFSQMNTSFPLIHLLFLQTQSISDDINYVNIQRVLCTSSGFSNMLVFEMHLKCREDGRSWVLLHWKRENNFLCAIPGPARNDEFFQVIDCFTTQIVKQSPDVITCCFSCWGIGIKELCQGYWDKPKKSLKTQAAENSRKPLHCFSLLLFWHCCLVPGTILTSVSRGNKAHFNGSKQISHRRQLAPYDRGICPLSQWCVCRFYLELIPTLNNIVFIVPRVNFGFYFKFFR